MKKLTPKDIHRLALARKSIIVPLVGNIKMPAAFLQNMQFSIVMRWIERWMYEYKPKKKASNRPWKGMDMIKSDF